MRNVPNHITDPVITLYANQYLIDDLNDDLENSITNDNWRGTIRLDTLAYWELLPDSEDEAVLVTYLNRGGYTAHLTAKGEIGSGLVEVFVIPYSVEGELLEENISP